MGCGVRPLLRRVALVAFGCMGHGLHPFLEGIGRVVVVVNEAAPDLGGQCWSEWHRLVPVDEVAGLPW